MHEGGAKAGHSEEVGQWVVRTPSEPDTINRSSAVRSTCSMSGVAMTPTSLATESPNDLDMAKPGYGLLPDLATHTKHVSIRGSVLGVHPRIHPKRTTLSEGRRFHHEQSNAPLVHHEPQAVSSP